MTKNRKLKHTIRLHADLHGLQYRNARANVLSNPTTNPQVESQLYSVLLGYTPDASAIGWAPEKVSSLAVNASDPSVRSGVTNSIVSQLKNAGHFVAFHSISRETTSEVIESGLSDFTRLAKRTMTARVHEETEADRLGAPDEGFKYSNLDDRDLYVVVEFNERITADGAELMRRKLSTVIQTGGAFGVHVVMIASDDEVFRLLDEESETLRVKATGDTGFFALDLGSNDPGRFTLALSNEPATSSQRVSSMA